MFRKMRREDRALTHEESEKILTSATHGLLAVEGAEGYPYAVPISHVYANGKIYFHGAKTGQKLDAIANNDKVCFTVVGGDEVKSSEFSTAYSSVIIFGQARILEDAEEIREACKNILQKFSPGYMNEGWEYVEKFLSHTAFVEIKVDHMTGKSNS